MGVIIVSTFLGYPEAQMSYYMQISQHSAYHRKLLYIYYHYFDDDDDELSPNP